MAIHKLQIDDFVTVDYLLIAIHSSLEDYRLAFFLNSELHILLEKCFGDITFRTKQGDGCFSRFIYEDDATETLWNLIPNKSSATGSPQDTGSLFNDTGLSVASSIFLLPELKKVDYLLKIENTPAFFDTEHLVESLLSIKHITTAYTIDHKKLKSKNNLIF